MNRIGFGLAAVGILAAATGTHAQDRWSFEVRGGAAFATQDLGEADLGTGFGFEGTVEYRFLPHLGLYGGWDWFHFDADDALTGFDADVEETGYAFGLRFEHPLRGESGPSLRLRAGGTYDHIEVEDEDGGTALDSGHGPGWEIGAGLGFEIGEGWHLAPGARFRSLSRDLTIGNVETDVDLSYVTAELAFSRRF